MPRRNREGVRPSLRAVVAGAIGIVLLAGCATRAPEPPPAALESYLLSGYSTWFAADVRGNAELYEYLVSAIEPGLSTAADRMDRVAGGMRLLPGSPPELAAVARGNFPPGAVRFALTSNRTFERLTAEVDGNRAVYFREREGLLQLAVPSADLLYLSTGMLLQMLPSRPPAELEMEPDVFDSLRGVGADDAPDALLIFDDPAAGLLATLGVEAPALPLSRIDLSITVPEAAGSGVEFGGVLYLRSEREARLFGRVGRFFVIILARALGLDGPAVQNSAQIEVEGTRVVFSEIPITREELVDVIRSLGPGREAEEQ